MRVLTLNEKANAIGLYKSKDFLMTKKSTGGFQLWGDSAYVDCELDTGRRTNPYILTFYRNPTPDREIPWDSWKQVKKGNADSPEDAIRQSEKFLKSSFKESWGFPLTEARKADVTSESKRDVVLADGDTFQIVQRYKNVNMYSGVYIDLIGKEKGSNHLSIQISPSRRLVRGQFLGIEWNVYVRNFISFKEGDAVYREDEGFDSDDVDDFVNKYVNKIVKAGVLDGDKDFVWKWIQRNSLRAAKSCFPDMEIKRLYYNPTFDPMRD